MDIPMALRRSRTCSMMVFGVGFVAGADACEIGFSP
jgi:hypothetical protein